MNGSVGVESEPGQGSMLWVTIPAVQSSPAPMAEGDTQTSPPSGLAALVYLPDRAMRSALEHFLSPFGNQITFATSFAEMTRLAGRGYFALVICDAESAGLAAASPGNNTPILALARAGDHVAEGVGSILRWPATANALYSAIGFLTRAELSKKTESGADLESDEETVDAATFATLEKSLGLTTLIDILQSCMATAEQLTAALSKALDTEEWAETARVAQDIGGAAGGLGLTALTAAARQLAQAARDGADQEALAKTAKNVLAQHEKARSTLHQLYPDLAA